MRRDHSTLLWLLAALLGLAICPGGCRQKPEPAKAPPPAVATATAAVSTPVASPPPFAQDPHPQDPDRGVIFDKPIDARYNLSIVATYASHEGHCCSTQLHIGLRDSRNPAQKWELGTFDDQFEYTFDVERVDPSAVVLCRRGNYGIEDTCSKFFLDLEARRLIKKIDFTWEAVAFADDAAGQRTLGGSPAAWQTLRARGVFATKFDATPEPPEIFKTHPMPKTSYEALVRGRPWLLENGQRPTIEETPWGWQAADGGFWFGKMFSVGEGNMGAGDVGFLDGAGRYHWQDIAEMADWAAQAVLVEPSTIWVGRSMEPDAKGASVVVPERMK